MSKDALLAGANGVAGVNGAGTLGMADEHSLQNPDISWLNQNDEATVPKDYTPDELAEAGKDIFGKADVHG